MGIMLIDFESVDALTIAAGAKYSVKDTLSLSDTLLLGDSDSSQLTRHGSVQAIKDLIDTSITAGTLANAADDRTVPMNSNSLTFTGLTTLDVNHTGFASFIGDNGIKVTGSTVSGKIRFDDADDTNYAEIQAPSAVTANYTMLLLTALPSSGTKVLTIDNTGQMDTTDLVDIGSRYRGGHDASGGVYPEVGGAEPPEIDPLDAIVSGDFFDIAVAGTLGGTPVVALDRLYAKVDSPGQTSTNWGIIAAPTGSTDTNITTGTLNNATVDRSIPFNAKNVTFDAMNSFTMVSTGTITATTDSGIMLNGSSGGTPGKLLFNDGDDSNTLTLTVPTNVTTNWTATWPAAPPGDTQMMTMTSGGQIATQAIPSGGTDTHIFDNALADQAANATHDQAGFLVSFTQTTGSSAMNWLAGSNGWGLKNAIPRIIGADNNWWTMAVTTLGELNLVDTGSPTF